MIRFKNQLPNYHSCIMAQKRKKEEKRKKGKKKNSKLQNSIIEPNERQTQLQFLIMFIVHNANYLFSVQCVCLYVYIYAACSLLSSCYENDKANFIISLIFKKGNRDPEKHNPSSHLFLLCQSRYFLTILLKAGHLDCEL